MKAAALSLLVLLLLSLRAPHAPAHQPPRSTCPIAIGPALDSIPRDAAFLLETCGCTQPFLKGVGTTIPAYLVSDQGDSVPMRLIRYDRLGQEQVLLGPGRYLQARQRYRLAIPLLQQSPAIDWPEGLSWQTTASLNESRVGFAQLPKLHTKMKAEADRAIIAIPTFSFRPLDSLEFYWLRITVADTWSGDEHQWIQGIAPRQDGIAVGFPLRECGPAPVLDWNTEYQVTFTLIGLEGDEGRSSEAITIAPE